MLNLTRRDSVVRANTLTTPHIDLAWGQKHIFRYINVIEYITILVTNVLDWD